MNIPNKSPKREFFLQFSDLCYDDWDCKVTVEPGTDANVYPHEKIKVVEASYAESLEGELAIWKNWSNGEKMGAHVMLRKEAEKERDQLRKELEAYKKAKAENDERFQLEAGKYREERDRLAKALAVAEAWIDSAPEIVKTTPEFKKARAEIARIREGK